jgi:hypothetical protein
MRFDRKKVCLPSMLSLGGRFDVVTREAFEARRKDACAAIACFGGLLAKGIYTKIQVFKVDNIADIVSARRGALLPARRYLGRSRRRNVAAPNLPANFESSLKPYASEVVSAAARVRFLKRKARQLSTAK